MRHRPSLALTLAVLCASILSPIACSASPTQYRIITETTTQTITPPPPPAQTTTITLPPLPAPPPMIVTKTVTVAPTVTNPPAVATVAPLRTTATMTTTTTSAPRSVTPTASTTYAPRTTVGGIISQNTTWTYANSPYLVNSNILVQKGVTLTIEPGVTVVFAVSPVQATRYAAYSITIDGQLVARGTSSRKILFTSTNPSRNLATYWGAIVFSDSSVDWSEASQSGSVVEYSIIEYGGSNYSLVEIKNSSPLIKDNFFRNSLGGLSIVSGNPQLVHNSIMTGVTIGGGSPYFRNNLVSGGGFYIVGGTPIITHNDITNCGGDAFSGGIRIDSGSPTITYNNIATNSENGIAILRNMSRIQRSIKIENNNFYGNKSFAVVLFETADHIAAPNNWWGTAATSLIDQSIFDATDDYSLGKVNYLPFAAARIADAGMIDPFTQVAP